MKSIWVRAPIGAAAVFWLFAAAGAARADSIAAGYDLLETDSATTLDDLMLPAGFFGPGSDPFVGRVYLRGVPFDCFDRDGPGPLPPNCGLLPTDTIIRRMAAAGPTFPATIPIEIVALSLRSVSPIAVTFGGGASTSFWTVDAEIRIHPATGSVDPPQTTGSMTIRHEFAGGGTFDSTLPVTPKLTFTRVDGPGTVGPMVSPITLMLEVSGESWSHVANPLLFPGDGQVAVEVPGLTTAFFPGCVCAACPPPPLSAVSYSVDGGVLNPARNGAALTPLPNPAEGLIVPDPRHVVPNDVYALGTSPGAPPGAPPGGHGYATEGEVFQSAGAPLGTPPNGSNVDRMSASLGIGPAPAGGPPFLGPFSPNPGAPAPAPIPPGGPLGTLGLLPNDNIDALSYGKDSGQVLLFSVDPAAMALPGMAVRAQALTSPFALPAALPLPTNPGGGDPGNEAAGDVFKSLAFAPFGSYIPLHYSTGNFVVPATVAANELAIDEVLLGLQAPSFNGSAIAPPEDDLDGLEMSDTGDPIFGVDLIDNASGIGPPDGIPDRPVFFSIDTASPSIVAGIVDPNDILVTPPGGFAFLVYADGVVHIGLLPGDDIDALALSDVLGLGVLDPGFDEALFSLHPGSPSVLVGPDGIPGTGDEVSAADVFYTSFTGSYSLYASAGALGLLFRDNLNALDILPQDIPVGGGGGGGGSKKKLSKEEADLAKHGIRVSQKRRCNLSTTGNFTVTIFGLGTFLVDLAGPTSGIRTATLFDPWLGGTRIDTELLSMNLIGNSPFGPVRVTAGREMGLEPSPGEILPQSPRADFPGRSSFDVLLRIEVGPMRMHNQEPFRVSAVIDEFPPYGHTYQGVGPVQLFNDGGMPVGTLDEARHRPRCQINDDCDDLNPCTADSCDPGTGACTHSPLPDADGDGICDAADNCAVSSNPGQGAVVFPERIRWTTRGRLCWSTPATVRGVRGPLSQVASYAFDQQYSLIGAVCLLSPETPGTGTGFYYLIRPNCVAASWQTTLGGEPHRDIALP